ncbi:MAG TPA: adenosylcobalamin-dependent ribonucleoside-diphosphate reductase, partial [Gammaproteobacteria bacterium]|nr:adenosylcobalamin-dependent ribonucleoside-diphosphate reductase [Gammaproteobacteria bacterium]
MTVWDAMCGALMSTGARRGAMMGTLRCDHPDARAFIDAKRDAGVLTNFNLSLQVTDAFMAAVVAGEEWPLCFPGDVDAGGESRMLRWPGADREIPCRVTSRVSSRALWSATMAAAYDTAEPGVLFVDRINRANNLYYCEHITSTNPCGEIPLPPYGACVLGSINLTTLVERPFSAAAALDIEMLDELAARATRFLDDVIDVSAFPLAAQRAQVRAVRRVGLGVTGLGDALLMLGLDYASEAARALAAQILERIRDAAYRESIRLAEEKGPFPAFERDAYLAGEYVSTLPTKIRDGIARHGVRNSHLLAIAPTGTISLLANNVSSGIEPVFAFEGQRRILNRAGQPESRTAVDFAYAL